MPAQGPRPWPSWSPPLVCPSVRWIVINTIISFHLYQSLPKSLPGSDFRPYVKWELPPSSLIPHVHIYPFHPHLFTSSSTGLTMSFTLDIFLLGESCSWCACLAGSGDDLFKCQKATHCGLHNPGMDTGIISFGLTKI